MPEKKQVTGNFHPTIHRGNPLFPAPVSKPENAVEIVPYIGPEKYTVDSCPASNH